MTPLMKHLAKLGALALAFALLVRTLPVPRSGAVRFQAMEMSSAASTPR